MKKTKKVLLMIKKIKLGTNVTLSKNVDFWGSTFDGYNSVGRNSEISYSTIGKMSYLGKNCLLNKVEIGNFCSIGDNVKVIYGSHPTNQFFSTHPAFFSTKKQSNITFVNKDLYIENKKLKGNMSVIIQNDVWIGSNVSIFEGVKIGTGSILAAGAVVIKDVPPYSIVGGVPAKLISYRFKPNIISELLKSNWWSNDIGWFENLDNLNFLNSIIKEN